MFFLYGLFSFIFSATLPVLGVRINVVDLHEGQSTIEIYSYGDRTRLQCVFKDSVNNELNRQVSNHCVVGTNNISLPSSIVIWVYNIDDHPTTVFIKSYLNEPVMVLK